MTEQYYLDSSLWGNGQLSLKDVIDRILIESKDEDSIIRNADRNLLILLCKKALRELGYISNFSSRAVKFEVPSSLSMPVEEDFTELIRLSVIDGCNLNIIKQSKSRNSEVVSYIQHSAGDLIFDDNGQIFNSVSLADCEDKFSGVNIDCCQKCTFSESDNYKNSSVQIIKGQFIFSYDLEEKEVLIEYLSNGLVNDLNECEIKIKPIFEEALIYYTYWKYLEKRVNTANKSNFYRDLYLVEYNRVRRNEGFKNVSAKSIGDIISKYR